MIKVINTVIVCLIIKSTMSLNHNANSNYRASEKLISSFPAKNKPHYLPFHWAGIINLFLLLFD